MAVPPLLAATAATRAIGQLSSGLAEAGQSRAQAHIYANKAITDAQASDLQENADRRSGRQTLGEQIAQIAQNGGGFGGSNGLSLDQTATNASMKALAGRWSGLTQVNDDWNKSLFERAKARTQTQRAFFDAFQSGLDTFHGKYPDS